MDQAELIALLRANLGAVVVSADAMLNDDVMLVVDRKDLVPAAGQLKNDPALGFTTLMNHLGIDYGDRMAVVYNLFSAHLRRKLTLKVYLDRQAPAVQSLERAFPGIGWYERETYDMFGITYAGISNPRRLLLPDDWEGFPLRKDYVYPEMYGGIVTGRKDLLDEPSPERADV